jgi:hypothetical protein
MGRLILKRQNLTNLLPYTLDTINNFYIFKGGAANTIGTVFNKDDFIKNLSSSNSDRLAIFTPDLASSANYWVRSSTNLWTRTSTNTVSTDVVIPENYVILIFAAGDPSSNLPKSINNGAIIQKYYQGKTSIKKQNLSILKGQGFYPESEVIYIFKSAVNNTLGSIFNYLQFEDYIEILNIYYEGSISGQLINFASDGSGWTDLDTFENRNNYVIPANSIITINLGSDKNITVGGGAIIQRYNSGKISLNTYIANDPDARNYISAVEAADGSPLEASVKKAIDNFIIGCKSDGIWTAIKASCLLAGAKTLNGALVPLVGTAPTNNNFVPVDYDRKTGLLGDGMDKYLSSNRNNNADPQNSKHLSVYCTSSNSRGITRCLIGTQTGVGGSIITTNTSSISLRINYASANAGLSNSGSVTGFISVTRIDGLGLILRALGNSTVVLNSSTAPLNANINVFSNATLTNFSDGRIAFYSIGENIDLQKLDNRVTDYINAISSI